MHDDDNRLIIMKEEPQLAIWAVYTALTLLLLLLLLTTATLWEIMAEAGTPQHFVPRHPRPSSDAVSVHRRHELDASIPKEDILAFSVTQEYTNNINLFG